MGSSTTPGGTPLLSVTFVRGYSTLIFGLFMVFPAILAVTPPDGVGPAPRWIARV